MELDETCVDQGDLQCPTEPSASQQRPIDGDSEPVIGQFYSAVKVGKGWRRAEVISTRFNSTKRCTEYFVHFDGDDRRMDTWIPVQMIDTSKRRTHESPEAKRGEAVLRDIQGAVTRSQRNRLEESDAYSYYGMDPVTYELEKERERTTRIKHVSQIHYGGYRINTWYFSPYLGSYGESAILYVCDRCFKYMKHLKTYRRHRSHCTMANIAGENVYEKDNLIVFEVDGEDRMNKRSWVYCQNVCLTGKMFLDHKTVCYDADPFWFYVLYECDERGQPHGAGYFSKEKWPSENNNLSCITVFPPYQRKGYGSFLIQFSYLLSRIEGIIGGPERPLSDFGRKSYRNFWTWRIVEVLKDNVGTCCTLKHLSDYTGILQNDIVETFRALRVPYFYKGLQLVRISEAMLTFCCSSRFYRAPMLFVDPEYLKDIPHLHVKRSKKPRSSSLQLDNDANASSIILEEFDERVIQQD